MRHLLVSLLLILLGNTAFSNTILVKNISDLQNANKNAQPGDTVILVNGEWKDVSIKLDCKGTIEKPIVFKAETPGKVVISGNSRLKIGGSYIVVSGLYFTNGYSGNDAVISFRIDKDHLANHCRVTNTVINDFNNARRMDENNWVLFYGKKNRLDNCSFVDKKNMGVLLAVILDDERSRENHHEIENNYFGRRPPLASNGGEIIRVGVSQHCQFSSNTEIRGNFFEHCDGETEIISIKSCDNLVEDNLFKECQGSVVLRHGDNNTVSNNIFYGNDKVATGGVRVINKGQIVRDNLFYKVRGTAFKAPLAVMNGIPNSPAHRYVQVTDAEITDNIFYECSALSFCEGSDAERTLPPDRVTFEYNVFYNTKDSIIYTTADDMKGFNFEKNKVSSKVKQQLFPGFTRENLSPKKLSTYVFTDPVFSDMTMIPLILRAANSKSGAGWFQKHGITTAQKAVAVNCATAEDIYRQLERQEPVNIRLTGTSYNFTRPLVISNKVIFTGESKKEVRINTGSQLAVFLVAGKGNLALENLTIDGTGIKATHFISNDSTGSSEHYNVAMRNCTVKNINRSNGGQNIIHAFRHMIADSIVIRNSYFIDNATNTFAFDDEKEDKGYYSSEKIIIANNNFRNQQGSLLSVYRGGNDESTLGPQLLFANNKVINCVTVNQEPLIHLTGVQVSNIYLNEFTSSNAGKLLIEYKDIVRAKHSFDRNTIRQSGNISKNQLVTEKDNRIQ
jgi:poly(beta-D-mannuronate) lyase